MIAGRKAVRAGAQKLFEEAKAQGNQELIKHYSIRAASLKSYMVSDAKKLLNLMGIPWVQAPGEGGRRQLIWLLVDKLRALYRRIIIHCFSAPPSC